MSSLLTWYLSPFYEWTSGASQPVGDFLSALNTLVSANSADADASWEVIEYVSASPRSLMLGRKNGSPGRVLFFGQNGSTPDAAAVRSLTSSTSQLFVAYSASSSATNVSSWLAGAPLAAADYMPGVTAGSVSAAARFYLSYLDHADGFFAAMHSVSGGMWLAGGGEIIEDENGTAASAITGTGPSIGGPDFYSESAGIFRGTPGTNANYANATPCIVGRIGGSNIQLYRLFAYCGISQAVTQLKLLDLSTCRAEFFPIWLVYNTTNVEPVYGKFRQIAYGPASHKRATRIASGSPQGQVMAYGLGGSPGYMLPTQAGTPVWFPNFQV